MQNLTTDRQDLLEANGFQIAELTGFDSHSLALYAHRAMADKKPGDVVLNARVGNPESLDDGEATYLARKAFHGLFPWLPGKDCMKRTFVEVSIGSDGRKIESGARANGSKWCRKSTARRRTARKSRD